VKLVDINSLERQNANSRKKPVRVSGTIRIAFEVPEESSLNHDANRLMHAATSDPENMASGSSSGHDLSASVK
jgi:hypothetical protein